ncbi:MAG: DNA replication and repair protein RecF [Verrucomicrobia bacterium]|nr:DNA replication and repair protein RecF [Verrucomicrobiota bacterium]MDA1064871.1 DNA replication and repair protein RecF [Verrucomicrobiota bacterium]
MQITRIRLQNYRNIAFVDISLSGLTQFFVGKNAQGKTNLLEATGLLSALRSFRTHELSTLLFQGHTESRLIFDLEDERFGKTEVSVTLKRKGKEVIVDGEKVTRFRDFIGRFPIVVLSSQDIQLLRGSPGTRRQWLDLVLSSGDPAYYDVLGNYHKLLQERNSLLKVPGSPSEMKVFEKMLAEKATLLRGLRASQVPKLEQHLKSVYKIVSPDEEFPELLYHPDSDAATEDQFLNLFIKNRQRDRLLKSTQQGPHRDELTIRLESRKARDYASEGQQRSMIISLKIAQLQYLHEARGILPVLLADDVLGELDKDRKENFWKAVGNLVQVIGSGTEVPSMNTRGSWQLFDVSDGEFFPHS